MRDLTYGIKYRVVNMSADHPGNAVGYFHRRRVAECAAAALSAADGPFPCQLLRVQQRYPGGNGFWEAPGLDLEEA